MNYDEEDRESYHFDGQPWYTGKGLDQMEEETGMEERQKDSVPQEAVGVRVLTAVQMGSHPRSSETDDLSCAHRVFSSCTRYPLAPWQMC